MSKNAIMILSKGQATAICKVGGVELPEKRNQRVTIGEAVLWHMPPSFRPKKGAGRGKCFSLSAKEPETLRPHMRTACDSGSVAIITYGKE